MQVKSISYIHSFNVTGFLNDKVGIEIELNENDSVDEAYAYAIQKTKEIATNVQNGFMEGSYDKASVKEWIQNTPARLDKSDLVDYPIQST